MRYIPELPLDETRAPHFSHREVASSFTAKRLDISNIPTESILLAARLVAVHCLEPIRREFGPFTPSSWYRSPALERVITRTGYQRWVRANNRMDDETSWLTYLRAKSHPRGEAVDLEVKGVSNVVLFEWCRDNLRYDQLLLENYRQGIPDSGWVHISYRIGNMRMDARRLQV